MERTHRGEQGKWTRLFCRCLLVAGLLVSGSLASSGPAHSREPIALPGGSTPEILIDAEEDCLEPRPETASLTGVTDDGRDVSVEVLVLLDGVPKSRGREIMDLASEAYVPLSITLRTSYQKVAIKADSTGVFEKQEAIDHAKRIVGGSRPEGIDVVYILTSQNIDAASGFADCVGGVRYESRAFAVGEDWNNTADEVPVGSYEDVAAKIAAHEIGHLLGAHHHYANCAEGVSPDDLGDGKPAACTLMFGYLDFWSFQFGTFEGAVIRGHATRFADS